MSTRGCIARLTPTGFTGSYHHWDSYPSGLGATLWRRYHEDYDEDLERMLVDLIDKHSSWSTINRGTYENNCHCHGDESDMTVDSPRLTENTASGCGVEYAYVFDEKNKTMHVLSSYCDNGHKMVGFFGMGDPEAKWVKIAEVALNGEEPNWNEMEKR